MDQVDFGVKNCCNRNCSAMSQSCDKKCKTVFIHKITIEVCPKSWAQDYHRLLLQPHDIGEVFGLQRSSTLNVEMSLDPRKAAVSHQIGNTISSISPGFGWSPARRADARNSVSWTWELHRYTNGRRLELNRPIWGSRPLLGIRPDQLHIHDSGSFLAEASWELQPSAELQQERLEWDVKISMHTAVLQTRRWLPAYSVTTGPVLSFERRLTFSEKTKN